MTDFHQLVPIPAPQDVNTGLSAATPYTMLHLLGKPGLLTRDCSPITNPRLHAQIVTHRFNNFAVTGWKPAVESLVEIMTEIYQTNRELHAVVRTAGMLCCRRVRKGTNYSNHSWGTAIDLMIEGQLDPQGARMIQRGMLALYPYFHKRGWYWGVEFSRLPDAMHFELAESTVIKLYRQYYG